MARHKATTIPFEEEELSSSQGDRFSTSNTSNSPALKRNSAGLSSGIASQSSRLWMASAANDETKVVEESNAAVKRSRSVLDYAIEARSTASESELFAIKTGFSAKEREAALLRELGKRRNEKLKALRKAHKMGNLGDANFDEDGRFDVSFDANEIESIRREIELNTPTCSSAFGDSSHALRESVVAAVARRGQNVAASQNKAYNQCGNARGVESTKALGETSATQSDENRRDLASEDTNLQRRQAGTNLRRLAAASGRDRFAFVTPFACSNSREDNSIPDSASSPSVTNSYSRPVEVTSETAFVPASSVDSDGVAVAMSETERTAQELIAKNTRLRSIEPKLVESILAEILDTSKAVAWSEIAGLRDAKRAVREAIVLPLCNPRLFESGSIRAPPRGVLLFGPPGNGKTMIGKCVASQVRARFFAISSSTLTSKWVGDGEKLVRALFLVAAALQPSVIFIDEIDSLLSKRNESEHESSRRMKTEFLVQLDGVSTSGNERVLVIGATNRPDELDEAARRRFPKRIYVPLPDVDTRRQIVERLLSQVAHSLLPEQLTEAVQRTDGFSAADLSTLCREAAMYPIRELASNIRDDDVSFDGFGNYDESDVRAVNFNDLLEALVHVKPSVSPADLTRYETWNQQYGLCS